MMEKWNDGIMDGWKKLPDRFQRAVSVSNLSGLSEERPRPKDGETDMVLKIML